MSSSQSLTPTSRGNKSSCSLIDLSYETLTTARVACESLRSAGKIDEANSASRMLDAVGAALQSGLLAGAAQAARDVIQAEEDADVAVQEAAAQAEQVECDLQSAHLIEEAEQLNELCELLESGELTAHELAKASADVVEWASNLEDTGTSPRSQAVADEVNSLAEVLQHAAQAVTRAEALSRERDADEDLASAAAEGQS